MSPAGMPARPRTHSGAAGPRRSSGRGSSREPQPARRLIRLPRPPLILGAVVPSTPGRCGCCVTGERGPYGPPAALYRTPGALRGTDEAAGVGRLRLRAGHDGRRLIRGNVDLKVDFVSDQPAARFEGLVPGETPVIAAERGLEVEARAPARAGHRGVEAEELAVEGHRSRLIPDGEIDLNKIPVAER